MLMKSTTKISAKLLLSFAAVLALVMGLGYSSLTAIGGLGSALDVAVNGTAKKLRLVGDLQTGFEEMRADARKTEISLLNGIIGELDTHRLNDGVPCGSCHTSDTVDTQRQQFEGVATRLSAQVAQLRPLVESADDKQAVQTVDAGIADWPTLYRQYLKSMADRDYTAAHHVVLDKIDHAESRPWIKPPSCSRCTNRHSWQRPAGRLARACPAAARWRTS
jgi:hypothetical protein